MSTGKKIGKTPGANTKKVKIKYPPPRGLVLSSDEIKNMTIDTLTDKVWGFIQEYNKETDELNAPKR